MKLIVIEVTEPKFKILHLSDLHKGNRYCDESAHDKYLGMVNEKTHILLNGDLCEAKMRKNKGRLSDQTCTPGEQLKYWKKKLYPYRNRIDAIVSGNHEETIIQEAEIDILSELTDYLNTGIPDEKKQIQYDSVGVWICYVYHYKGPGGSERTITFNVYMKHGHSSAALPGGKLNAANRIRWNVAADLILTGHVHQFTQTPGKFYDISFSQNHKTLKEKEQWTVTNGSCLDYGGYAETGGYQAQPIVQTMIYVEMMPSGKVLFDVVPIRPDGHRWAAF